MFNPRDPLPRLRVAATAEQGLEGLGWVYFSNENLKLSLFLGAVLNIVAPVI